MKKQGLFIIFLFVLFSLISGKTWGQMWSSYGDFVYEYQGTTLIYKIIQGKTNEVALAKYHYSAKMCPSGDVVIPSQVTNNGQTYTVTKIEYYALGGCEDLTSVEMPNTVDTMGGYAFSGCTNLKKVTIPASLKTITSNAFGKCTSLETIICEGGIPSNCNGYAFYGVDKTKVKLIVPSGSENDYGNANVWKDFLDISSGSTLMPKNETKYICQGDTYTFGDTTLTTAGTYTDTLSGNNGNPDTLYTLTLVVKPLKLRLLTP
jgi:hypothetical protein